MNEGKNDMLDLVELEDGMIIDGTIAKLVCEELRVIYNELKKKDDNKIAPSNPVIMLPKSWGLIGINNRDFVYMHIYTKFPYLLLCFNNWKVIAIAGPVLSQWWNAEKNAEKMPNLQTTPSPLRPLVLGTLSPLITLHLSNTR